MASNNTIISDADLKSRLANFGIVCPISNTTRPVLLKKLLKLEKDSLHEQTTQTIDNNYDEKMVSKFRFKVQIGIYRKKTRYEFVIWVGN